MVFGGEKKRFPLSFFSSFSNCSKIHRLQDFCSRRVSKNLIFLQSKYDINSEGLTSIDYTQLLEKVEFISHLVPLNDEGFPCHFPEIQDEISWKPQGLVCLCFINPDSIIMI